MRDLRKQRDRSIGIEVKTLEKILKNQGKFNKAAKLGSYGPLMRILGSRSVLMAKVLHEWSKGKSSREVAKLLDTTQPTVFKYIYRAKKTLDIQSSEALQTVVKESMR